MHFLSKSRDKYFLFYRFFICKDIKDSQFMDKVKCILFYNTVFSLGEQLLEVMFFMCSGMGMSYSSSSLPKMGMYATAQ
jgi:hypothetical protein